MGETANYKLYVEDDNSTKFIDWRTKMNGSENSNMTKIDEALHDLDERVNEASGSGGLIVNITEYEDGLLSCDANFADIKTAIDKGWIVEAIFGGQIYNPTTFSDSEIVFSLVHGIESNSIKFMSDGTIEMSLPPVFLVDWSYGDTPSGFAVLDHNGKLKVNQMPDDVLHGNTPIKGIDYFTDADKAAFVNDVLAALPKWTGGSY